ncbi:MAG: hypothetical protein ACI3V0_01910 [Faecousia sp.]
MSKRNEVDDFFLYEMVSKESNGSPTGNGGCLPWILGGIIVVGAFSKLLG